jgi:4-amino-4-deoxy-L-arabinose transferase-like glycosyltransferase
MKFLPIIIFYLFLFLYSVEFLSFSFVEIDSINHFPFLKNILHLSSDLFGKNDYALRFPSLFTGFLSVVIFYNIAKLKLKTKREIIYTTYIFMLIPGMIISSVIVNKSVYLIFLSLLFIYSYEKFRNFSYILLILYVFVDKSLISLYLALIFYSIYKKDTKLLIFSLILLAFNANYFEYKIHGRPKGYFLDLFGTYFLIFSPFVFVYFLYALYKNIFYKKDLIYFISATAFFVSLILSFRQKIKIDDYAPYTLGFVVNMVNVFLKSYKVRLPRFRTFYKILFVVLFTSLIMFDISLFFNKYTPAKKLSFSFYFPKNLAEILKKEKIYSISCNNEKLSEILEFYGIKKGDKYKLIYSKNKNSVSIFHKNKIILKINVSKLNTI